MAALSDSQVRSLVQKYFGDLGPSVVDLMVKIAKLESGYNPAAIGDNFLSGHQSATSPARYDYGLFQINSQHGYDATRLTSDLDYNLSAARQIYDKQGPKAWSTYEMAGGSSRTGDMADRSKFVEVIMALQQAGQFVNMDIARQVQQIVEANPDASVEELVTTSLNALTLSGQDTTGQAPGQTTPSGGTAPQTFTAAEWRTLQESLTGSGYFETVPGSGIWVRPGDGVTTQSDMIDLREGGADRASIFTVGGTIWRDNGDGTIAMLADTSSTTPPNLQTLTDERTGQTYTFNPLTGETRPIGQFGFPGIDPERDFAENQRQFNVSENNANERTKLASATSGFQSVNQLAPQLGQLALSGAEFTRDVLRNPSDFLARAFFQRGGESPLPVISQADVINQLRSNISGFNEVLGGFNTGPLNNAFTQPTSAFTSAPTAAPMTAVGPTAPPPPAAPPQSTTTDPAPTSRWGTFQGFEAPPQPIPDPVQPSTRRWGTFQGFEEGGFTREPVFIVGEKESGKLNSTSEMIINPTGAPVQVIPRKDLPKGAKARPTTQPLYQSDTIGPRTGSNVPIPDSARQVGGQVVDMQAAFDTATGMAGIAPGAADDAVRAVGRLADLPFADFRVSPRDTTLLALRQREIALEAARRGLTYRQALDEMIRDTLQRAGEARPPDVPGFAQGTQAGITGFLRQGSGAGPYSTGGNDFYIDQGGTLQNGAQPTAPQPAPSSGFTFTPPDTGFQAPQLPMPAEANQADLVNLARQNSPPAVTSLFAGEQPADMQFGFPLFSPQQLDALTPAEKEALNTRLAFEGPGGTTLQDVEHAVRRRFSNLRASPRARFAVGF